MRIDSGDVNVLGRHGVNHGLGTVAGRDTQAESEIRATGEVQVDVFGHQDGDTSAILAHAQGGNAANMVEADGNVRIFANDGTSWSGDTHGIQARAEGDTAMANNNVSSRGAIEVGGDKAQFAEGHAYGLRTEATGEGSVAWNTLLADQDIRVVVRNGNGSASGIASVSGPDASGTNNAGNTLEAGQNLTVAVNTEGGNRDNPAQAVGISIQGQGMNHVTAWGHLTVEAAGQTGNAYGLVAENDNGNDREAANHIHGAEGIRVRAETRSDDPASEAVAVHSGKGGLNSLATLGSVTLEAEAQGGTATAIRNSGQVSINPPNGNFKAHAYGYLGAKGIESTEGDVGINAYDHLEFTAHTSQGEAVGIDATDSLFSLSASADWASVDVTAFSENGQATGIAATGSSGSLTSPASVTVTAMSGGDGDARGLLTTGAGGLESNVMLQGNMVNVVADAGNSTGNAYALYAENGSGMNGATNTVVGYGGGPLVVTITATAGSGAEAVALWANGGGAVNRIEGRDDGDIVLIEGDVRAINGGVNEITTGAGNDRVTINGNISGTGSLVDTGADDDIIVLNGSVAAGSLTVIAGEGQDRLVLVAEDAAQFEARYKDWLDALGEDGRAAMSVEEIEIQLNGDDFDALSWINDYFPDAETQIRYGDNLLYGADLQALFRDVDPSGELFRFDAHDGLEDGSAGEYETDTFRPYGGQEEDVVEDAFGFPGWNVVFEEIGIIDTLLDGNRRSEESFSLQDRTLLAQPGEDGSPVSIDALDAHGRSDTLVGAQDWSSTQAGAAIEDPVSLVSFEGNGELEVQIILAQAGLGPQG